MVDLVGIEPTTCLASRDALARYVTWKRNGGPGRDRTDDLFHAIEEKKQPEMCFQVVSNRNIGWKTVYWTMFPANFRPNL